MWCQASEESGFSLEYLQLFSVSRRLRVTSELRHLLISSFGFDLGHCGKATANYVTVTVVGCTIYYFVIGLIQIIGQRSVRPV